MIAFTAPFSITRPRHSPLSRTTTSPIRIQNASKRVHATASQAEPGEGAIQPVPFPTLYDAWYPPHQLRMQMQDSVTSAFTSGKSLIELQWPTVPNLEEISAGTLLNFRFGKQVAEALGMASPAEYMLIKRYLAEFCNLYWAVAVAQCEAFKNRNVWVLSCDGVSKKAAKKLGNVRLGTMREPPTTDDGDVVILLDPRVNAVWERGVKMKPKNGATVFLNSQFSESYGLTGPRRGIMRDIEGVYFLKRVTRGYAFRAFPGKWRAVLEKPDMAVEELRNWDDMPSLRELAGVVRGESNRRYGGFYNDRYVRGFGGRL